jgi:hypothetical protein
LSEFNPLVERVDALLKRHQQQASPVPAADPDTTLDLRALPDGHSGAPAAEVEIVAAAPVALPEPTPAKIEDDFPVLTEVVESAALPGSDAKDAALAAQVEAVVLEKVLSGLDRTLDQRLGRTVSDLLEQAMDGLRADLSASVRELVREAVATAVQEELAARSRPD